MGFQRATRGTVWLKMAISGPSGSGKTMSSLKIATTLAEHYGSRVAVIDTEASARLYADGRPFDFDVLELADFAPETYVSAIAEAYQAGYKVLVIDSISHEWTGKGGVLEIVDRMKGTNGLAAWKEVTPRHTRFIEAINRAPLHIICTMRAKEEVRQERKDGRTEVVKLGMQPIQRDGMSYEFSIHGMMDQHHTLTIDKTRCEALTDGIFPRPGEEVARVILAWLDTATDAPTATAPVPAPSTFPTASDPAPETDLPVRAATTTPAPGPALKPSDPLASKQQVASIRKLCVALGKPEPEDPERLTDAAARLILVTLSNEYNASRKAQRQATGVGAAAAS